MKQLLSLLLVFISAKSIAQNSITFRINYSDLYATYDFLMKISDSYPDNELKTIFRASPYNTAEYTDRVTAYERLVMDYNYSFGQYPAPLKLNMMSRDLLERNLVLSKNVDAFVSRSLGIIPQEDLTAMASLLERFLPVYRNLVSEPYKTAYEEQKQNLLKYLNDDSFSRYFQTGLDFYGTAWDSSIPIELNLLLSLDKGNLGARAFGNVAVCEASAGLQDHVSFFSVAIHEIYHIIYDNQSLQTKHDIQHWFNTTKSPNSQYALLLLNEVLATALGNGYVIEQLNGKTDAHEWYGNRYISQMAKAIYPVVKDYIKDKKPMDEAFVQVYVKMYDTQFPQWANELNHLFTYRYIVADTTEDWLYLRKTYRYHSYSRFGAPISPAEIEKVKATPITKLFIISQNHHAAISLLKDGFTELKDKKMNANKEFINIFRLKDNTRLFIINRHQSTVEQLMDSHFPKQIIE